MVTRGRILLIEGKRSDHPSFYTGLSRKGFHVERAATGSDALIALSSSNPQLILLDAASLRSSGRRICQSLIKQAPGIPIVIIFGPDTPPDEKTGANVTLQLPFTLQKLLNRIRGLMPVEEKDAIQVGEMQLDVEHRWVRVGSRQVRLTPRLVVLLKILMDRAGEVIERKELFSQVWDTDYTDDTRTLDVHISWLRQALEEDPRNPEYIKTVRGVGYRLDLKTHAVLLPASNRSAAGSNDTRPTPTL